MVEQGCIATAVVAVVAPGTSDAIAGDGSSKEVEEFSGIGEGLHLKAATRALSCVVTEAVAFEPAVDVCGCVVWGSWAWVRRWRVVARVAGLSDGNQLED